MESTIGPANSGVSQAPRSAFSITTPAPTIKLDASRQASADFTVTNASGRALRGQAKVVAVAPAVDWLKIDGQPERDFPVGGTQQVTVRVTVPDTATASNYSFRLGVTGTDDPDEQYAESSDVSFVVTPIVQPVETPWWRKIPWWVFVAAAALVLVIVGVVVFLLLRNVTVPNVVGQTAPSAQATLQASSLGLGNTSAQPVTAPTPFSVVLEQAPAAGAKTARNSAVDLVVSRAPLAATENDAFAKAFTLEVPGRVVGSTTGGSTEVGEPVHAADSRCFIIPTHQYLNTVWFRFQPTKAGTLTISTANPGTNFDTALAVYTGTSIGALSLVGCDNNGDGSAAESTLPGGPKTPTFSSILHVPVTAGQTYLIQLAGIGGATAGNYNLTIQ